MSSLSLASNNPRSILCVVGARPNFMKMAPVISALSELRPAWRITLLHTGQHYDASMNHQYFEALGIRQPDLNLEVGSGSHAQQTAEVMRRFEPALDTIAPCAVLVVGDVNSTLACALVASKKQVPVMHVEAGLRSFDRSMPEEINRILTDQISDLLFTTERSGKENLVREGINESRIRFVGNVMIDTLRINLKRAVPPLKTVQIAGAPSTFLDTACEYAMLTLHRPSNVDAPRTLRSLLEAVREISSVLPLLFPMHPRTATMIQRFGLGGILQTPRILLLPPQGYLEMLGLMKDARVVLTDSGGIQEETTALGVPCITLRSNTERPVTVEEGTNTIAGQDPAKIFDVFGEIMRTGGKVGRVPQLWDGNASVRIAEAIDQWHDANTRK